MSGEQKRLFDIQLEILTTELQAIDSAIRQHDEITKSIKNWAVVTWTASLGVFLKERTLQPYLWVTAVVPFVFWFVDGSYRRIQRTFITRVDQIAAYLNSEEFRLAARNGDAITLPLMKMRSKGSSFSDTFVGAMFFRTVSLLYGGLVVCSLAVWFLRRG